MKGKCCKKQKDKSVVSRVYKRALLYMAILRVFFLEHYKYCMAEAINPNFGEEQNKIYFYKKV